MDALVAAFASKNAIERQKARQALTAIGRPATRLLAAALADSRKQVRWEAAKALVRVADATAGPELVAALEDEDMGVRWLAAEALIAAGPEILPVLLQALIDQSDSSWLREGSHHVIHAFAGGDIGEVVTPVMTALEQTASVETVPVAAAKAISLLEKSL
jgi:HEAT repeat protein